MYRCLQLVLSLHYFVTVCMYSALITVMCYCMYQLVLACTYHHVFDVYDLHTFDSFLIAF